jgi:hypothetical protein
MLSTFVFAHLNSQVEQLLDVEHIPFLLELPPYICLYISFENFTFFIGEGGGVGRWFAQMKKNHCEEKGKH